MPEAVAPKLNGAAALERIRALGRGRVGAFDGVARHRVIERRLAFGRELHLHVKTVSVLVNLAPLALGLRRVLGGGDESLDPGVLKGAAARCLRVRTVVGVRPVLCRLLPGKTLRLRL